MIQLLQNLQQLPMTEKLKNRILSSVKKEYLQSLKALNEISGQERRGRVKQER